jgi:hypothetical protein
MATQFTARVGNQARFQQVPKLVGATVNIEQGKFYVEVGGYLVVPAAANALTGKRPCLALTSGDNGAGLDGAVTVLVEYGAMYDFANDGVHPCDQTNVGSVVYLSSATTISDTAADGPPAGEMVAFQPLDPPYPFGRPVRVAVE